MIATLKIKKFKSNFYDNNKRKKIFKYIYMY